MHLQVVMDVRTFSLAAHVLRCAVWSLDPHDGITYRGALRFEHRCELFWEPAAPDGSGLPALPTPPDGEEGNLVPAMSGLPASTGNGAHE